MGKQGMNPDLGLQVAANIAALSAQLDGIRSTVAWARTVSLGTMALVPGSVILAPASIPMAMAATNQLANAQAQLAYLVEKLRQEAQQQHSVSNSLTPLDAGWFAPGPTANKPGHLSVWDTEWEYAGSVAGGAWSVISWVDTVVGIGTSALEVADKWWKTAPDWVHDSAKVVGRGGKVIPWVGTGVGGVNTVLEWDNDNWWGNTRNIIGNVLDVASVVSLIPPLTVASPFIAAGSLFWDLFDLGWDLIGDDNIFGWF